MLERESLDLCALDCWQSDKMQLPADHEISERAIRNSGSWMDGGIIGVNGWSSHPVSCKWVVCATELVFEAWCCTSKFCPCCTDLNQLVWGNPVAKHRGASLDGISRFYFVASCLPTTLLCDLIKAKYFNIGNSSACLRYLTPTRIAKVSPPAYEYDATSSFDNRLVSMI